MQTIKLNPFYHKDKECIGIYFSSNATLDNIVRRIPSVKWSQTHKCWYTSCTKESYINISKAFAGKAIIEKDALKIYLQQRNQIAPAAGIDKGKELIVKKSNATLMLMHPLTSENLTALDAYKKLLI